MTSIQDIGEIKYAIGEINGTLKSLNETLREHVSLDRERFDQYDKRISSVERKVWYGTGAVAAVTFGVTSWVKGLFGGAHP